jgi:hypothetical protein
MKRSIIYIIIAIIFTSLNCCSNGGDELEAMPPISAMYFSTHRNFNVKLESNIYVSDPTVLNMTNTISISV